MMSLFKKMKALVLCALVSSVGVNSAVFTMNLNVQTNKKIQRNDKWDDGSCSPDLEKRIKVNKNIRCG